ncbi:MAG TPA: orotidine-5'-phosphate decarboxylase, partial [Caulobacter sp.]|nr:orotidine-5'-phosphate decarboxylase [Caulobacter sp.]
MPVADPRLIVALDLPSRADAEAMVEALGDSVGFYKIGLQMLAVGGMDMARDLKQRGRQVFMDWKLHDIGATVEKATAAIVGTGACDLLTVHAQSQVLRAAVRGRAGETSAKILGVTVLTSLSGQDLAEIGYGMGVEQLVERRIRQAVDAGADGVVASPHEAALARRIGGPDFLVVTPGVRPDWAGKDDQARAATPAQA